MGKQLTINGVLLLLCERLEMAQFLHVYLQYLFRQGVNLPTVQLFNYRGLEQLAGLAERLPQIPGSGQVEKILIFADAQDDLDNRKNTILDVRSSRFFRTRDYCAHFFFPGRRSGKRWRNGYLEDLLLETLAKDACESSDLYNLLNMAREYLVSVEQMRRIVRSEVQFAQQFEHNSKALDCGGADATAKKKGSICMHGIARVFTSCENDSSFKFINPSRHLLYTYFSGTEKFIGCSLAEAAKRGAFDFEHERYAELKKCLLELGGE
ncbi:MAG: hypothetical protein ACI3XH_07405 [Phascolarctobacterium sp.]